MSSERSPAESSKDEASSIEAFAFRVLAGVPKMRSIPGFALRFEKGRAVTEEAATARFNPDAVLIARHIASTLQQGRYGPYTLIGTRTRTHPRTVVYATWVAFSALADAEAFQRDHPKLGMSKLIERTAAILQRLSEPRSNRNAQLINDLRWRLRTFDGLRQHTGDKTLPRNQFISAGWRDGDGR